MMAFCCKGHRPLLPLVGLLLLNLSLMMTFAARERQRDGGDWGFGSSNSGDFTHPYPDYFFDRITVPIRPPFLPPVPQVTVRAQGSVKLVIRPTDVSMSLGGRESLGYTAPRYIVPDSSAVSSGYSSLQAPSLILDAICSNFSIELTNMLPFQPFHSCPAGGDTLENGPKDYQWTNLHTHGLKVDPGATNISNLCEPGYPTAGLADPDVSIQDYYCNDTLPSTQFCRVRADNIFVIDRPLVKEAFRYGVHQHPGATIKYTYPLRPVVPGVGWYHPHQHGSVAIQTTTAAAPWIVPESYLPGGLRTLYEPAYGRQRNKWECDRLLQVLEEQPLERSTMMQIYGIWFRNTTAPNNTSPDDDTIPFLGSQASPPSSLLFTASGEPLYTNPAGRDWALINGAFQPTIEITAQRYSRWQVVNTMTMKWLDLTLQKMDASGNLRPAASCKLWLLARDGVPLPEVPRLLSSKPEGCAQNVSDIILGPANRADLLVKCNAPGTYVLASGAGPFHTNYNACRATHCECFGDRPANGAILRPANNLFGGRELDAAVLAVVKVSHLPEHLLPDQDFDNGVCRSRLELFQYLDFQNFPRPAVEQCYSFMNQMYGGMCSINNQVFPKGVAYVEQGSQQIWKLRDITLHPFHLHETPVRLKNLPPCATQVTNNWMEGDWLDAILLPTCQSGCPWPARGSGNGTCGDRVTVCDQTTIQWLATQFNLPFPGRNKGLCPRKPESPQQQQLVPSTCIRRVSVFHCHILPHEDEGCMALVVWFCKGQEAPRGVYPAQCPSTYTTGCTQPPPSSPSSPSPAPPCNRHDPYRQ